MMIMEGIRRWIRKAPPDSLLAVLDIAFGSMMLLQGDTRNSAMVSYRIASELMNMRVWGLVMILIGSSIIYVRWHCRIGNFARRYHSCFTATTVVRVAGPAVFVCWAVMAAATALAYSDLTFTSVPFYLYIAYRHHWAPDARECEEEFSYRLVEIQQRAAATQRLPPDTGRDD